MEQEPKGTKSEGKPQGYKPVWPQAVKELGATGAIIVGYLLEL